MTIGIKVTPEFPKDIIYDTFEGVLLVEMLDGWYTENNKISVFLSPMETIKQFIKPSIILPMAEASDTPLAEAALPILLHAKLNDIEFNTQKFAHALGRESFGPIDLLQEICRIHGDRVPFVEVISTRELSGLNAGAIFITADAILTQDTNTWFEHQRNKFKQEHYPADNHWNFVGHGTIAVDLPHTSWQSLIFDHPKNKIMVKSFKDRHDIAILSVMENSETHYASHAHLNDAKQEALELLKSATNSAPNEILMSMSLSPDDWKLSLTPDGLPVARWTGEDDFEIGWISDYETQDGYWSLRAASYEIACDAAPQRLKDVALMHMDNHPTPP